MKSRRLLPASALQCYALTMKYARTVRKPKPAAAPATKNVRVKIHGRHDLEQLSMQLQKMIASLQDRNVHAVQWCSVYFEPLDSQGERKGLWDEKGRAVEVIEIGAPSKP